MRTPKAPKEDPAVVAAREREERRAEASRTEETQAYLLGATQRRLRRNGRVGSGGSVPIYGRPMPSGVGPVAGGGSGSGSGSAPGRGFGAGLGPAPGLSDTPVLY